MADKQIIKEVLHHYASFADCTLAQLCIAPLGNGLINQTWLVRNTSSDTAMVLQRLNTQVFPQPWSVINNARKISEHLQSCIDKQQYSESIITPILTKEGHAAVENEHGFWRGINFFPQSIALDSPNNLQQVTDAAAAYGRFIGALSRLNPDSLDEVIAHFHHLPARLVQLEQAIESDHRHRLNKCLYWINFAQAQSSLSDELLAIQPRLPKRIVHNDTKLNNLLFNKEDMKPLAVIDLDTCMPGYLMYDFGDMVRAMCASKAEDMQKFDDIHIKLDEFSALSQGYLASLQSVITQAERDSLWLGVKLVTLELAVRFLTDYLNGDQYFHISHPEQNLQRARNQFTLYQSLLAQENTLEALIPQR